MHVSKGEFPAAKPGNQKVKFQIVEHATESLLGASHASQSPTKENICTSRYTSSLGYGAECSRVKVPVRV